jgi:hypothetical protein
VNEVTEPTDVAAVARALNVDPQTVRSDTPLSSLGWSGSAGEWTVVSDHLGCPIELDPPETVQPATIGELVAIVMSIHERAVSTNSAPGDTTQTKG